MYPKISERKKKERIREKSRNLLNTDLQYKDITDEITVLAPDSVLTAYAYISSGMVNIYCALLTHIAPGIVTLLKLSEKYAPYTRAFGLISCLESALDVGKIATVTITPDGNVRIWLKESLVGNEPFTIQYPLKRN